MIGYKLNKIYMKVEYNLGNPTYMGPRHHWITKNDRLLDFPDIVYHSMSYTILTYGVESFLRSCQLCSNSGNSQQF
jgi:hypothetical protein